MDRPQERGSAPVGGVREVLFVQGGGAGAHDEWDDVLVEGLRAALGPGHEVRYPRMPAEDDPDEARWSAVLRQEWGELGDGAVVVGHSVGGTILVQALAESPPRCALAAIVLVAAPFVGRRGWPSGSADFSEDLAGLPPGVPVHVFHGTDDDTVPPAHAGYFADAVPHAHVHVLAGRDHQLNGDLREVAQVIRSLPPTRV